MSWGHVSAICFQHWGVDTGYVERFDQGTAAEQETKLFWCQLVAAGQVQVGGLVEIVHEPPDVPGDSIVQGSGARDTGREREIVHQFRRLEVVGEASHQCIRMIVVSLDSTVANERKT